MIKLLIGGSPCTNWSIAQRKNRETTASGIGWELFLNYVIAKEKFKPDFFLYENNKSAAPAIKEQISIELGVPLMHIDSALVSAQTRILQGALKGVPRDEEIIVLSMYDGIATGRYCLDQMGFTNIRYYAYEIDPYAIKVAKDNYPDIIECGDAFDLRKEGWRLPE